MKTKVIRIVVLIVSLALALSVVKCQQSVPFQHTPTPLPNTVGPAGYIGTSSPTNNKIPGLEAPTGYHAPGLNGNTGPTGAPAKTPGVIGTTDYIVPPALNGQTGVTGLPGNMGWP